MAGQSAARAAETMAADTNRPGLDLAALRAHAAWVSAVARAAPARGGRVLARSELTAWAGALHGLLGQVERLAALASASKLPGERSAGRRQAAELIEGALP